MLKKLTRHATAFVASFAIAYSAVTYIWIVPFALSLPAGNQLREMLLRSAFAYVLRIAIPAAAGAALPFLLLRRRLQSWNVITVPRTALIGGLAAALWTPAVHTMFWLARTMGYSAGRVSYLAFPIACGAISTLAMYFPWATSDGPRVNAVGTSRDLVNGSNASRYEIGRAPDERLVTADRGAASANPDSPSRRRSPVRDNP